MGARRVVVCDNGTGYVKVGFAGAHVPAATFPALLGRPVLRAANTAGGAAGAGRAALAAVDAAGLAAAPHAAPKAVVYAEDAVAAGAAVELSRPMEAGIVTNWDDMAALWRYAYEERLGLGDAGLDGASVLLTEAPLNPRRNRERMAETHLEGLGAGALHVAVQAVLALYAAGMATGVVLDAGDGVTHVVPVYEGVAPGHLVRRLDVAGRDVSRRLAELLGRRGYGLGRTSSDLEAARSVKERLCFVSADINSDRRLAAETTALVASARLPDGRTVAAAAERFEAPEVLFSPELVGKEVPGVAEQLVSAVAAAPIDARADLLRHVVLSGGSTMFPGFPTRLEADVRRLYAERVLKDPGAAERVRVRIDDAPGRGHAVFQGGAVLAELMADTPAFWLTRAAWEEGGARALDAVFPR